MIPEALRWLEHSSLAAAMRGASGWEWLYPIIETLHVIFLGVVFGTIAMLDLRLLGLSARANGVSQLAAELLPLTWVAFTLAAITGALLFISRAEVYFGNFQFQCKLLSIVLAGINMLVFHLGVFRRVNEWDHGTPPAAARLAGALSISLWVGVVFLGRWMGFTT